MSVDWSEGSPLGKSLLTPALTPLSEEIGDDVSGNIRQAEIAAGIAVGKALVIEPQEMEIEA